VEIGVPIGISPRRPALPEIIGELVQSRIGRRCAGPNTGADDVRHQNLHGLGGEGVIPNEIAHSVAQRTTGDGDFRICCGAASAPAVRATPAGGGVIATPQVCDRHPGGIPPCGRAGRDGGDDPVDHAPGHIGRGGLHVRPRLKLALPATGRDPPELAAICPSMKRMRARRSAALP
jgi:hypothetical protein